MAKLELTGDLLTGHAVVDRQHRALFAWGNEILEGDVESDATLAARAINFLGTYVKYHFAAEEFLMARYRYERMEAHLARHALLREKVAEIQEVARTGGDSRLLATLVDGLLRDWYVDHIGRWDMVLAKFLKSVQSPEDEDSLPTMEQLLSADKLDQDELDLVEVVELGDWRGGKFRS